MQFKSLRIQGFKSFVDKTLIEFPKGITAIVGPNGSGKSNIMDALRWVFGEQRASELRGGDMEDVIFSGSDNRKQSGYAEVALTLGDLSPEISSRWGTFSDITVSRKIYRTGEREYFINNRRCRLKDIKDIFFDTGLGAKSISIIEQERVTKIVNSSPEELRYFLEETAGVTRYKERRKEAELRLKQTEDNLSRINDLLSIMFNDIEKLSYQVEKVNIYKKYKNEKFELEKMFLSSAYSKLIKDQDGYRKNIDNYKKDMADITGKNQITINFELELHKKQEELRQTIGMLRKEYDESKSHLIKTEAEINTLNNNITDAGTQKEQLQSDLSSYVSRVEELEEQLYKILDEIEETDELLEDFTDSANNTEDAMKEVKVSADKTNDELKKINSSYIEITQKITENKNSINLKKSEQASNETIIIRLEKEQLNLSTDSNDLQAKVEKSTYEIKKLETQLNYSRNQLNYIVTELNQKEAEIEKIKTEFAHNSIQTNSASNKIDLIEQDIASKSVDKNINDLLEKFKGEPYININKEKEAHILYSDLVVFDNKYENNIALEAENIDFSIRYILKSNLNNINPTAEIKEIGNNFYKHGDIFRKIGKNENAIILLSLKKSLEEEKKKLDNLIINKNQLETILNNLKTEIIDIKSFQSKYIKEIKNLETEYNTHEVTIKNILEHSKRTEKHIEIIEKELQLAQSLREKAIKDIKMLSIEKEKYNLQLDEIEHKREIIEEKSQQLNQLYEEHRDRYSHALREVTKYTERKNGLDKERISVSKEKIISLETINNIKKRMAELEEVKVEEWKNLLEKAEKDKIYFSKKVFDLAEKIIKIEHEQQDIENHLYEIRENLSELNKEIHSIELKIADMQSRYESAEMNMKSLSSQMQEAFGIDISEIWKEYSSKLPGKQQLIDLMNEIEKKIEELGPLNMAAEAEFSEKKEEYDKQLSQQSDIENAVANLKDFILNIDESTVKLFEETYKAVRKNFIQVFNRFFGSGSGDLTLTDPGNLLNTGVEISINPPGKKVSHRNLLSGGEKALSALTLLFALFLQKPTPFCFLDEVDAPLDDANVARFINMVTAMSEKTQFVIITHKHQTMASADSLYGVTMQEGGVSTILSVELKKSER